MITDEQQIESEEILKTLIKKSWNSSEFKNEFLKNPNEIISREMGKDFSLPEGQELVVEDQTDESTIFINIPRPASYMDELQLTDEQLECVSGGEGVVLAFWIVTALAAGVTVGNAVGTIIKK